MSGPAEELASFLATEYPSLSLDFVNQEYSISDTALSPSIGDFGSDSKWSVNVSSEPAEPDDCITIYDTGGAAPYLFNEKGRSPTIQVRVRSRSYQEAYDKQEEIFNILNAIKGSNIGGHTYLGVWLASDIISLGADENDRSIVTANYSIMRGSLP